MTRFAGQTACFVLALLLCASVAFAQDRRATDRMPPPNIVFILLDNVGQEWFGCYGSLEGRTTCFPGRT